MAGGNAGRELKGKSTDSRGWVVVGEKSRESGYGKPPLRLAGYAIHVKFQ